MKSFGLTRKQVLMLVVMIFGTFIAVLNQTLVTPALPSIMADTGVNANTAQWLTTGFTLVNAIMIPITAFLTDRFSMRNLFLVAMAVFALGSALAGWGPNFPVILAGRLVQAAGEGVMMPLVMTELMLMFPVERRGTAMGLYGLVIGFAPALGPTAAGLIIDKASWHDLFFIVAGLSVVIWVFSAIVLEHGKGAHADATLDIPSVISSTLGFGALLYGLSVIGSDGVSVAAAVSVVAGALILVYFFRRQLKMEQPMLQVRVLANRKFLIATIIGMVVQGALMAAGILVPIYLQSLRGFSATTSGLVLLPGAVIMALMGLVAGRLFDKHGPRALSLIGTGVLTLTTFGFALLGDSTSLAWITVLYTVRLFSLSLVNMPINTWGMNALDNRLMNHGTSVSNTFRQVAGSLGTAVIVSVSTAVTSAASSTMDATHAGIHGTNMAFVVAGCLCDRPDGRAPQPARVHHEARRVLAARGRHRARRAAPVRGQEHLGRPARHRRGQGRGLRLGRRRHALPLEAHRDRRGPHRHDVPDHQHDPRGRGLQRGARRPGPDARQPDRQPRHHRRGRPRRPARGMPRPGPEPPEEGCRA